MKPALSAGALILLSSTISHAGGLDRSGQSINIIFEEGNLVEFSYGNVSPTVTGNSTTTSTASIGNTAADFSLIGLGLKFAINDQLSFAIISDEPYGADISYPDGTAYPLTNTSAQLDSRALTGILRYSIDDNFSVHAGIRSQEVSGNIVLPATNIEVDLAEDTATGYLAGLAYERDDIGLRIAVSYFSEVDHNFLTTTGGALTETLEVTTPQAINVDFQTAVAQNTVLFGSMRWAEYSVVSVAPTPVGTSIIEMEDSFTYELGVGHRFGDRLSGSISVALDEGSDSDLVSPLIPVNGSQSLKLAAAYKLDENTTLSGAIAYTSFGDAIAASDAIPYGVFGNNSAVTAGFKLAYNF